MIRSSRCLPLPLHRIFSDSGQDNDSRDVANSTGLDANCRIASEWSAFLRHCEALLQSVGCEPSDAVVNGIALRMARIIDNSFRAGVRESAVLQTWNARAGKKRKVDERGNILRHAILSVCRRQNIIPVASEKFANSIRSAVILAAEELGLVDSKRGTSVRSIHRHIAVLAKDGRI